MSLPSTFARSDIQPHINRYEKNTEIQQIEDGLPALQDEACTCPVKCDETHPSCRQCTAASVACPGYSKQLRWSSKHEVFPKESSTRSASQNSPPPSPEDQTEKVPGDTSATQEGNIEQMNLYASPELTPVMGHGMQDIMAPGLGFFDDIFDMSPPFGQDIGWSMRPALMFDDWNSDASLQNFEASTCHHKPLEAQRVVHTGSNRRSEGSTQNQRPSTPISDQSTSTPDDQVPATRGASKSLLETFYRLSSPNKLPSFSESDLVGYFLNEVCPLLSVFDSDQNPFRTIVADHGTSSKTVNLAMQSMAVGHLANHYPYMAPVGLSKRWQAWRSLQKDLAAYRRDRLSLESILISILLLGSTSVWHPGPSQGPQYLLIARNIMRKHLQDESGSQTKSLLHEDFFQNCLIYWEQTMSFVDPTVTMPAFPGFGAPALSVPERRAPVTPHPWTGISPEVHFAIAEVGRILRRRQRFRNSYGDARWADSLEIFLYSLQFPGADEISDFGDQSTSKEDLIRIAEACRFFGLIELYAVFPELLSKRLEVSAPFRALGIESDPAMDGQAGEHACWLSRIALHMIETVKAVPISSGASRSQVAILVSVSSHLRLVDGDQAADGDEILAARYFVESSLLNMARKYAQRPAAQAIDLVKEVWARMDSGASGEHWMEVAHEKGWLSFLG